MSFIIRMITHISLKLETFKMIVGDDDDGTYEKKVNEVKNTGLKQFFHNLKS